MLAFIEGLKMWELWVLEIFCENLPRYSQYAISVCDRLQNHITFLLRSCHSEIFLFGSGISCWNRLPFPYYQTVSFTNRP